MQVTLLNGYPDLIGKRSSWAGYGNGPTSYSQTVGDMIELPGFQYYIDAVFGGVSVSGTYFVIAQPSAQGPRGTWYLKWFTSSTGAEVSNAVNLSAEKVQIGGLGGSY